MKMYPKRPSVWAAGATDERPCTCYLCKDLGNPDNHDMIVTEPHSTPVVHDFLSTWELEQVAGAPL